MAKEFGNGAIGVMLFCMLENGEIEEVDLDKIAGIEPKPEPNLVVYPDDDSDDFDWI
jgi:hypothetical protein